MNKIPGSSLLLLRIFAGIFLVAVTTELQTTYLAPFGIHHPFLLFIAVVVIAALYLGPSGGLAVTVLSALSISYFLTDPPGQFFLRRTDDRIMMTVFVLEGLIITYAAEKMRRERQVGQALKGGQIGTWDWKINSDNVIWNEEEYKLFGLPEGSGLEPMELFY